MSFQRKQVRCSANGLTQEKALESLYEHPQFRPGTRVIGINQVEGQWVATLDEPTGQQKQAAPPPPFVPKDDENTEEEVDGPPSPPKSEDSESESGDAEKKDSPPSPEDGPSEEGPPKPKGEDKGKGSEHGEIAEVLNLIHAIADKLGITPDVPIPGAEDGPPGAGPPGPPPPPGGPGHGPPGGPPPGAGGPPGAAKPMPKLPAPRTPPLNAPAFASNGSGNQVVGKVASFTASEVTDIPIKEAKRELESLYSDQGYKVKQIREGHTNDGRRELHALLSVR